MLTILSLKFALHLVELEVAGEELTPGLNTGLNWEIAGKFEICQFKFLTVHKWANF